MRAIGALEQMQTIPALIHDLKKTPKNVHHTFNDLKEHCTSLDSFFVIMIVTCQKVTNRSAMRFFVTGNVFDVYGLQSKWEEYFGENDYVGSLVLVV